jgi:hypothetical protein
MMSSDPWLHRQMDIVASPVQRYFNKVFRGKPCKAVAALMRLAFSSSAKLLFSGSITALLRYLCYPLL